MVLYPEAMRKAQAEIDAVVGRSRLPNFDDRKDLPYVQAMIREVFRWRNIGEEDFKLFCRGLTLIHSQDHSVSVE